MPSPMSLRIPREVVLGPVPLTDGALTMRTPRLRDAEDWSAARIANRTWLERAFPAWGDDWEAEQSASAWARRWWHLRSAAARDGALPFVILLDGRLIGELGVDAIDPVSRSGEASVWMVRDHGSAGVMNAASLLLIDHAFTRPNPIERMLSPVATSSRAGRTPGLSAVGFEIEATISRPVGRGEPVDHDMWVLHNTPASREKVRKTLTKIAAASTATTAPTPPGPRPAVPPVGMAVALGRGLAQVASTAIRARRSSGEAAPLAVSEFDGALLVLGDDGAVTHGGRPRGRVELDHDAGTATMIAQLAVTVADPAFVAAVVDLLGDASWPDVRILDVRRPLPVDDGDLFSARGFDLAATYPGRPDSPHGWHGERRWVRAANWTP